MTDSADNYPAGAYAPGHVLWWELRYWPGTRRKFGDEQKTAAWLAFNVSEGETFTMRTLRRALGEDPDVPNSAEHLNRRLRNLRPDDWVVPSNKDDRTLPVGTYRLDQKGWHPGLGPRPKREGISDGKRRRVFDRDGFRCMVCGIGRGEPYPDKPESKAVLTVGHRLARELGGSTDLDNLQTECKRCNEPVRQEMGIPETLTALMPDVRGLRKEELRSLRSWLEAGHRIRTRLDLIYDRVRRLSASDQDTLRQKIRNMLDGDKSS
ncbi:HNH endonuclease [Spirillospora sp. CA-142024]|uniref:HNH endonuclease n=1 Tax=Spirillospora sp. CA-142024 TaxID=3240036 RepID=UPI003D93A589